MTDYSDRADATLLVLKDIARDMEAHLGLANRTRDWNPNLAEPSKFIPVGATPNASTLAKTRSTLTQSLLPGYRQAAGQAVINLRLTEPASPTAPEITSRDAVKTLAASIQSVTTHAGAVALVATL